MIVKINVDELPDKIRNQLEDWSNSTVKPAANEAFKEAAQSGKKRLKSGGTYSERTGKYTKDWEVKIRNKNVMTIAGLEQYTVYNKKNYQLAHLLEKGHQSRNGGRVQAYEHIEPTEQEACENATRLFIEKVERG